jgi:hypothetical protein
MKKFLITAGALVALAVPSAAVADPGNGHAYGNQPAPNGYAFKDAGQTAFLTDPDSTGAVSSANLVAIYSSQAVHNGSAVSVQAQAGMRSTNIQDYLGH